MFLYIIYFPSNRDETKDWIRMYIELLGNYPVRVILQNLFTNLRRKLDGKPNSYKMESDELQWLSSHLNLTFPKFAMLLLSSTKLHKQAYLNDKLFLTLPQDFIFTPTPLGNVQLDFKLKLQASTLNLNIEADLSKSDFKLNLKHFQ